MIKKEINQKGIGLVEVIAALGIGIIVITALVSLTVFTLRASTRGKLLIEGSKLANEQLELVRAYRDSGRPWENTGDGFVNNVMGCTAAAMCYAEVDGSNVIKIFTSGVKTLNVGTPNELTYGFYTSDSVNGGNATIASTIVRISVEVSWSDGDQTRYSYIYSDVSNWRSN